MAIKMKSASEIAQKFARVTPGRSADYQSGIADTSADEYASATIAAEEAYEQGVTQAMAEDRFGKGVSRGKDKWKRKSEGIGTQRYPTGVSAAAQDYEEGFAPYADVISGLTLPPRGPKGDPKNIERVRAVAEALRKKKVSG